MCWGGGLPGRQGRQAGKVTRQAKPVKPLCAGGAGCQAGEASRAVKCWGGWVPGRRGRSGRHVRELGGGGQYAGQARLAGHYVLGPIRRGRSGHHVLGEWRAN